MDKLSIYELLSFIIPGYIAAKIIEYYLTFYEIKLPFPMEGNLDDNLLLLVVSIILGVFIHVLTFKIISLDGLEWMKDLIYKKEKDYIKDSKNGELAMIIPAVAALYEKEKNHQDAISEIRAVLEVKDKDGNVEKKDIELDYYDWTFDFAYYYLEVNDKITQAKNFQSFYFLFRNLFVMSMVHFAILILLAFMSFIKPAFSILNIDTLYTVLLLAAITWLIAVVTNWLRGKMIDRVLWSYYVDRRTKQIDNQNKQ